MLWIVMLLILNSYLVYKMASFIKNPTPSGVKKVTRSINSINWRNGRPKAR